MDRAVVYSHAGMVQTVVRSTAFGELKTVFSLPLLLTLPVWLRYQFSVRDIRNILRLFSPKLLLACSILYGTEIGHATVSPGTWSDDAISYGGKGSLIKRLVKAVVIDTRFNGIDVLRSDNVPTKYITREVFEAIGRSGGIFSYLGVWYTPTLVNGGLYCVRIISVADYEIARPKMARIPVCEPFAKNIGGIRWYEVTESVYFKCQNNSNIEER
jgi:hypothetical protein